MLAECLERLGARIDDVFSCPHDKDVCDCRKPRPGLVLEAARKRDIDLARSILIGDSPPIRNWRGGAGCVSSPPVRGA